MPLTTLDHVIEGQLRDRLDLIKDIEGCESRFLVGAKEGIARFRPITMIELNRAAVAQFGATPEEVVTFLEGYGYRFYQPSWNGFLPLAQLPGPNDYFNVTALNSSSSAQNS